MSWLLQPSIVPVVHTKEEKEEKKRWKQSIVYRDRLIQEYERKIAAGITRQQMKNMAGFDPAPTDEWNGFEDGAKVSVFYYGQTFRGTVIDCGPDEDTYGVTIRLPMEGCTLSFDTNYRNLSSVSSVVRHKP
jgi:hypothetical protein